MNSTSLVGADYQRYLLLLFFVVYDVSVILSVIALKVFLTMRHMSTLRRECLLAHSWVGQLEGLELRKTSFEKNLFFLRGRVS